MDSRAKDAAALHGREGNTATSAGAPAAFGALLRSLMAERGMSLRGLARELHYDVGHLSKVSRDMRAPSPELARRADTFLGAGGRLVAAQRGGLNPSDAARVSEAERAPVRVDAATVAALERVLAGQRRLEDMVGPAALLAPMAAQLATLTGMVRHATGPHRGPFLRVVAEWTCFTGWLHAAVRSDARALELLGQAEELADEVGDGTVAAISTSFRGYVARQQGRPVAVVRASAAALAVPGAHGTQRLFDRLQAAQGYAVLGERDRARRLLDEAAGGVDTAGDPPPAVYWYTAPFFRLNIGMAAGLLGEHRDAAALLRDGLSGLPCEQQGAQWVDEYRTALRGAESRA